MRWNPKVQLLPPCNIFIQLLVGWNALRSKIPIPLLPGVILNSAMPKNPLASLGRTSLELSIPIDNPTCICPYNWINSVFLCECTGLVEGRDWLCTRELGTYLIAHAQY